MNVVVLSAHPDDEAIGCGGTLLKHVKQGDNIYWIIVTEMFENDAYSKERVSDRQQEIIQVADKLHIKETFRLRYMAAMLDSASIITLVPQIMDIFNVVKPEVFYIVNRSDAHSDHRIAFEAGFSCTKSFRVPSLKKVLMYECISETEFSPAIAGNMFVPNYFVDITDYFDEKLELVDIYNKEIGQHPFPRNKRNIEALAVHRGATAGVMYAEAFQVLKLIDK